MHFLASDLLERNKIWKYRKVVEDEKLESAWKVTDSVLLYVLGALLSCYEKDKIPGIVVKSGESIASEQKCEPMIEEPMIEDSK